MFFQGKKMEKLKKIRPKGTSHINLDHVIMFKYYFPPFNLVRRSSSFIGY